MNKTPGSAEHYKQFRAQITTQAMPDNSFTGPGFVQKHDSVQDFNYSELPGKALSPQNVASYLMNLVNPRGQGLSNLPAQLKEPKELLFKK